MSAGIAIVKQDRGIVVEHVDTAMRIEVERTRRSDVVPRSPMSV